MFKSSDKPNGGAVTLLFLLLCLVLWGAFIFFRFKTVENDARDIFHARQDEEPLLQKLGEIGFIEAYKRAYWPRAHVLNFGAVITALISLPTIFTIANWLWNRIWNLTGQIPDLEEGHTPWLFAISVFCILGLIAIGGFFARLYHYNRPKSLEEEIELQLKGNSQS